MGYSDRHQHNGGEETVLIQEMNGIGIQAFEEYMTSGDFVANQIDSHTD